MIVEIKEKNLLERLEKTFPFVLKNVLNDIEINPFSHYLAYIKDDNILIYINYYLMYDRIEIANFNVLEKFQNQGIGSKLLDYLIKKYDNIKNITLEVKCDNYKAIKLYEKFSFSKKAIRKGYYNGVDGILMERNKYIYF